jgi:FkbM family methyltransferase
MSDPATSDPADRPRALWRLIASSPARRLLKRPRIERIVSRILLSGLVKERVRFLARELPLRRVTSRYRLRESGLSVHLRHGTPDIATLDEIFYLRQYEMPPSVEALLRSIDRPLEVVDLGANIGLFGVWLLSSFPDIRLTAFEPDSSNAQILRRCIADLGGEGERHVIEACASNSEGPVGFLGGGYSLSQIAGSDEETSAQMVPAVDVFPYLRRADLIKVDMEGGEWAILTDPRFQSLTAPAIAMEYHPHLCPTSNPRTTAIDTLRDAGYAVDPIFHDPRGHGMVWAWRTP